MWSEAEDYCIWHRQGTGHRAGYGVEVLVARRRSRWSSLRSAVELSQASDYLTPALGPRSIRLIVASKSSVLEIDDHET